MRHDVGIGNTYVTAPHKSVTFDDYVRSCIGNMCIVLDNLHMRHPYQLRSWQSREIILNQLYMQV